MSRCWVTTGTRTEVLGRGCVEGGVGSGVARSAWVGRSGAGGSTAGVEVSVGPKWRGLWPAEAWWGWAGVCGARGVFEAVGGRAAKEPGWVGRRSVRARRRGSGVVGGGAGVRREAGPVSSTRWALGRARGTFKGIAGAERRRCTGVIKGGTKQRTLRGRWGVRQRRVREEEVVGDVHERTASGRGGSKGLGAGSTRRCGSRSTRRCGSRRPGLAVKAEAAVRDAEGLQGIVGDAAESRRRGRMVVQGEGVLDLDVEGCGSEFGIAGVHDVPGG